MPDAPGVAPGCEAVSHRGGATVGALVLHGFTGNPSSMRGVADAMIDAGFDVELPRLPGHGTTVGDMLDTTWADWTDEVGRAHRALRERVEQVVVVGQSMGATLGLWSCLEQRDARGLVCINPATRLREPELMEMIDELIEDGIEVAPGEGADIADPDSSDIAYDGTPLRPLRSLLQDGIAPITERFGELTMPLRLLTSRHDHVVPAADSEHLLATYGGPVEHTWLERSYHVATKDYDRDLVVAETVAFSQRVAGR